MALPLAHFVSLQKTVFKTIKNDSLLFFYITVKITKIFIGFLKKILNYHFSEARITPIKPVGNHHSTLRAIRVSFVSTRYFFLFSLRICNSPFIASFLLLLSPKELLKKEVKNLENLLVFPFDLKASHLDHMELSCFSLLVFWFE